MEQEWDLFRRGHLDQERHHRLVSDAIRRNLSDLVTHGQLTSGGRVRIPVKALKQWRFEFDPDRNDHTGTFEADPLTSGGQGGQSGKRPRKGDIVGYRPREGKGQGGQGGDGEGETFYEVEVGVEAVAEILFADLELPRMQRKQSSASFTEREAMQDIRKKGPISNLDKRRTVIENIRRNAATGTLGFGNLADDDLRFRAFNVERVPEDRVAVLFVRDSSGSMGEPEKHLTRVLSFWITRFLQYKYKRIAETAFVLFDTKASEVTEDEFIHLSEGGGTLVSTGFKQAQQIMTDRFPPERFNLYLFAFSDGDNPTGDNPQVVQVASQLLPICNLVGYADIRPGSSGRAGKVEWSSVAQELQKIGADHLVTVNIREQDDVLGAMKRFFKKIG